MLLVYPLCGLICNLYKDNVYEMGTFKKKGRVSWKSLELLFRLNCSTYSLTEKQMHLYVYKMKRLQMCCLFNSYLFKSTDKVQAIKLCVS